jgi:hypothetical protein
MLATALIRAVEQAGGHLEPDGDSLVVEAPKPLPEPIMVELRAHKAEVLIALSSLRCRRKRLASARKRPYSNDSALGQPRVPPEGRRAPMGVSAAQRPEAA